MRKGQWQSSPGFDVTASSVLQIRLGGSMEDVFDLRPASVRSSDSNDSTCLRRDLTSLASDKAMFWLYEERRTTEAQEEGKVWRRTPTIIVLGGPLKANMAVTFHA